ncbi:MULTISPECIES: hypothetical protein [unclassified Streptomyces]|uniref:hypothetical protein n=1 Tax=unclassified Streptomyces TaxID=2593676 RepID=UPI000C07CADD|nr:MULTISPECIES: hypothetical protein [unclassified Streptomyces]MYQ42767.1 hypothetical protein [Streptomyces sp. SID4921]
MKVIEKKLTKQALVGLAVVVLGVFGYVQIFTKGVERLPEKVCSGAVDRNIVEKVLPSTMTASQRGEKGVAYSSSRGTVFSCYVKTRGESSIFSGEVRVNDVSVAKWREGHSGGDEESREVKAAGIVALAASDSVSVYVPCTRPEQEGRESLQSYALIADARTIGDVRVSGAELQQYVAEFAYQILKNSYEVEECREGQAFPAALPDFE